MTCWQFSFLGTVEAASEHICLNDLMGKKAGAVLALLALAPGRARSREEIINLVWPEVDFEEARNRFKQQLALLRKSLEPDGVSPGSVLITNRNQAGLAAGHQSDVVEFQTCLRRAAIATEPVVRAQHLREALAFYKGEFAPGFYLDFLLVERERLAGLAEEARERLTALEANLEAENAKTSAGPLKQSPFPAASRTLPRQNHFFGREQERADLTLLLEQNRLVTLTGPGGTGKTRLLQEMQEAAKNVPLIFLSTLRDGSRILDAIVAALDLPDSVETALSRLQTAFTGKEPVLMLDNLEQLLASGGAEAVASLLEALPGLRLLVTSRLKLNLPQECVYTLAPLPLPDATALFMNRAHLARAHFKQTAENTEAITELCRRLDGLPLAIEMAAARAAILSPAQILARLQRRFDLLSDHRKDRDERHASLRAALDWGWGLLTPDVQEFFAQLCVFRGSFSLEAAESITGEYLAIDYLHYLTDASFLIVESRDKQEDFPRFRLLETLREYGREKWHQKVDKTLPRRHRDYYLAQATQWAKMLETNAIREALILFRQDYDNLRVALEDALVSDPLQALEFCRRLTPFWEYAYLKREALHYLNQVLHVLQGWEGNKKVERPQWARLHGALANVHQDVQEYVAARQHFGIALRYHEQQMADTEEASDAHRAARRGRAGVMHNLANTLFYENRFDEAQQYYAAAAVVNRESENALWLANNLSGLCRIYGRQASAVVEAEPRHGLFEQGLAAAKEAVEICRAQQQAYFLCFMLIAQSDMLLGLKREAEALPVVAECFGLAATFENWGVLAECLMHYHYLAFRRARWAVAAQLIGAVTAIGQRHQLIDGSSEETSHLAITEARRENLAQILGKEDYDRFYEAGHTVGDQVSVEALRTFVQTAFPDAG